MAILTALALATRRHGGKNGAKVSFLGRSVNFRALLLLSVAALHIISIAHRRATAPVDALAAPTLRGAEGGPLAVAPEITSVEGGVESVLEGVEGGARQLMSGSADCSSYTDAEMSGGMIVLYILGLLWALLGLAIVCDEYFVASLEKISEVLNLSEDVAGATFMAAGSSAPELFTSTVDVFAFENNVGVGTIVGSAVFNILVIIALSAAASKSALLIDWRPLTRDCIFYIASILALVGFTGDGSIEWGEALALVAIYALYIAFMTQNQRIFRWVDAKLGIPPEDVMGEAGAADAEEEEALAEAAAAVRAAAAAKQDGAGKTEKDTEGLVAGGAGAASNGDGDDDDDDDDDEAAAANRRRILKSLNVPHGHAEGEIPKTPDPRSSATARALQLRFRAAVTAAMVANPELPHLAKIKETRKKLWAAEKVATTHSTPLERFRSAVRVVILTNQLDGEPGGSFRGLPDADLGPAAVESSNPMSEGDGGAAAEAASAEGEADVPAAKEDETDAADESEAKVGVTVAPAEAAAGESEFKGVVPQSAEDKKAAAEEEAEAAGFFQSCPARLLNWASAPWSFIFGWTIPDCNKEELEKYYVLAFIMSILWIGALSYFLVDMAVRLGCFFGIGPIVMGLTVLAAGTSIPDALGSMVVAQEGMGNMAVSNAIGSNVFDICLGIGLPYFVATAIVWPGKAIAVADSEVLEPIIILLTTVLVVFLSLAASKWMLSNKVGYILVFFYLAFVIYQLVKEALRDDPVVVSA